MSDIPIGAPTTHAEAGETRSTRSHTLAASASRETRRGREAPAFGRQPEWAGDPDERTPRHWRGRSFARIADPLPPRAARRLDLATTRVSGRPTVVLLPGLCPSAISA